MNKFINYFFVAAMFFSVAILTSCDDIIDDECDDVYLVTEILSVREWGELRFSFEYDDQNRITKIIYHEVWDRGSDTWSQTLRYNSAGDLISITHDNGDVETFTRTGNIITRRAPMWEESGRVYSETFELNAQGLLGKFTFDETYDSGSWWKGIMTFQYQGRNVVESTLEMEEFFEEYRSEMVTATVTYDDKKSPFYHSNTPQWFLLSEFFLYGTHNNVKTINSIRSREDEIWSHTTTFVYTYNDAGFPISRTATVRWSGYEDGEFFEGEEVYTETFRYGSAPVTSARAGISPSRANVCTDSPRTMRRDPFGRRVENRRGR